MSPKFFDHGFIRGTTAGMADVGSSANLAYRIVGQGRYAPIGHPYRRAWELQRDKAKPIFEQNSINYKHRRKRMQDLADVLNVLHQRVDTTAAIAECESIAKEAFLHRIEQVCAFGKDWRDPHILKKNEEEYQAYIIAYRTVVGIYTADQYNKQIEALDKRRSEARIQYSTADKWAMYQVRIDVRAKVEEWRGAKRFASAESSMRRYQYGREDIEVPDS